MHSKIIFLLVASIFVSATLAKFHKNKDTDRLLQELTAELELEDAVENLSRARRVPSADAGKACGRKLVLFVLSVCGEPCDPKTGHDIATACCQEQCSDVMVREACCPNK
ncbi:unnamed protein product [Caenorhabditis brenneri]